MVSPASGERYLALLAPHREALERYARRALAAAGEAEDVLQAALLRCFRDFGRFVEGTSFRAFAFAFDHEVRNANRKRRPAPLGDIEPSDDADAPEDQDVIVALEREAAYEALLASPERVLGALEDPLARGSGRFRRTSGRPCSSGRSPSSRTPRSPPPWTSRSGRS